jgi:DNA-directed RNA polymerase specialized sigma24 family protein
MVFPATNWSVLAKATLSGETEARAAIEDLCQTYWQPLNQFHRARGYNETEADDLTQAFLMHLMEHSAFRKADQTRGRFRSFLLGALVRYLGDHRDREAAQKRGGGVPHASLNDDLAREPVTDASEQEVILFDRAWAVHVLRTALDRVRAEFTSENKAQTFEVARSFLPGATTALTYDEAGARLGMSTGAFTSELHRLRQRVKAAARDEVMRTVSAPHELEDEITHLQKVLMDRGTDLHGNDES